MLKVKSELGATTVRTAIYLVPKTIVLVLYLLIPVLCANVLQPRTGADGGQISLYKYGQSVEDIQSEPVLFSSRSDLVGSERKGTKLRRWADKVSQWAFNSWTFSASSLPLQVACPDVTHILP